jgi:hypothetical protein
MNNHSFTATRGFDHDMCPVGPQIEREAVVWMLCSYYRAVAGDPASFLLCESLIQRLPKNIHGSDDFQAYQRREKGLDRPALRENMERAK